MNKTLLMVIGIIVVLALLGGSFYGGMAYQRYQTAQARAAFLQARGVNPNAANGTGGTGGTGFGGGGFGGTITGQVKSVDGSTLTISTARNVQTITIDTTTQVEKADSTTLSSLQAGDRVIVMGQRDSSGNMTASQVLIIATPQ